MDQQPSLFDPRPAPALRVQELVRSSDPQTSLWAAIKAAKASALATEAVAALMEDGQPRIDEQIHEDLRRLLGFYRSFDVTRHARKALADAGYLRETGRRLVTGSGMPSREWVWAERIQRNPL